jgi:hypothetical protein
MAGIVNAKTLSTRPAGSSTFLSGSGRARAAGSALASTT